MTLDEIATDNLLILSKYDKNTQILNVNDKKKLSIQERETDYENIITLNDLEYSIYFSFYHIFTMYKTNNYSRSKMLFLMDDALCNIYEQFDEEIKDKTYINTINILYQIDKLLSTITSRYYRYKCYYTITDICDSYYKYFEIFLKECKKNYTSKIYFDSESSSESDSEDETEEIQSNKFEYIRSWLYNIEPYTTLELFTKDSNDKND